MLEQWRRYFCRETGKKISTRFFLTLSGAMNWEWETAQYEDSSSRLFIRNHEILLDDFKKGETLILLQYNKC